MGATAVAGAGLSLVATLSTFAGASLTAGSTARAKAAVAHLGACAAGERPEHEWTAAARNVSTLQGVRRAGATMGRVVCASAVGPAAGGMATTYWMVGHPGAYGNVGATSVADCTVATVADLEQIFTHRAIAGSPAPWIAAYVRLLAQQAPGTRPGPDAGLNVAAVLDAWQGPGIAGTKIAAIHTVMLDRTSVEAALRSGPLYGVLSLPAPSSPDVAVPVDSSYVALDQWTIARPGAGYSAAGAHAVAVVGFDATDVFLASWGYVQPVSWAWWARYAAQAWSITR